MSRIRGKDTLPEITTRSILHGLGLRFSLHRKDLPGKPDIVLPKFNTVIFVHGCYWHRHKGCKLAYTPKSRIDFWNSKFEGNIARDHDNQRRLRDMGWKVVVVWECKTMESDVLAERLADIFLKERSVSTDA